MTSVAVSPDGLLIASGSNETDLEPIYLWGTEDNTSAQQIDARGVRAFVFTPNSTQLIAQELNSPGLDVWDVQSRTRLRRLGSTGFPSEPVTCLAISPDGARLACGTTDDRVLLVDAIDGAILGELSVPTEYVTSVAFNPDGTRLLSCSTDGSIRLWDTTPRVEDIRAIHRVGITTVDPFVHAAFCSNGALLTLRKGGEVDMYDPTSWEPTSLRKGGVATPHNPVFGEIFFAPDSNGTSFTLYQELGESVRLEQMSMKIQDPMVDQESWALDTAKDAAFEVHNPLGTCEMMWDALCGYSRHRFGSASSPMVFSEDGLCLARTSSRDITLYNTKAHEDAIVLTGHTNAVRCVAFSANGEQLVSGSEDNTVRVWRTQMDERGSSGASSTPLLTLSGHDAMVTAAAFSPDGTRIGSGSYDMTVRVWNPQSEECDGVFRGHTHWVLSVAFNPDSTTVLSASFDDELRIWDAGTGACLAVFNNSTWHETLRLASDSSGILVGEGETERFIQMWSTSDTPSELATSLQWLPHRNSPTYNIDGDRWLWSVAPGRKTKRMCRIPKDWDMLLGYRANSLAFKGCQILDVSELAQYLRIQ